MATIVRDGAKLHWEASGDPGGPPLLLLNSIGTDLHLWDGVVPHLSSFRVVRMDARGHGRSDVTSGDYSLGTLADDAFAVLDDAGIAKASVAGVSLGGMVAMTMALEKPGRVSLLMPICTSATMDPAAWAARVTTVRERGTEAILDLAMGRFLSPGFRERDPETSAKVADGLRTMADDGYAGCAAAIRDMDIHRRLGSIGIPTLVVAGDLDTSTPFKGHGERIARAIPCARTIRLNTAHLAPLEAPETLARVIAAFLGLGTLPDTISGMPSAQPQSIMGEEA